MPQTNPDKRAKELHSLLDKQGQNRSTTAVGNTEEEQTIIVGTSDQYMRKAIFNALLSHETPADSENGFHAEENVIAMAEKLNLHLTEIGASRPICSDCEELLKAKEIEAKTEFSGKNQKTENNDKSTNH
jgi:hypothetical protein